MPYRFATEQTDYSDYAAGRVFYSLPGHPAFPVRLTSEIFQRCLAIRRRGETVDRYIVYDPCCGAAYHLAALGHLHGDRIEAIAGSDVDVDAVGRAAQNLALLTPAGLSRRIGQIEAMRAAYGKTSHAEALDSARALQARFAALVGGRAIPGHTFVADALHGAELAAGLGPTAVDIVLTDVPYGRHSEWRATADAASPIARMLDALLAVISEQAVVAIAADKKQRIEHRAYTRVERFQIGKRQVALLVRRGTI